ncbi:TldD/PmbA family protein [Pseudomonas sp. MAG002Y]|uniref:TldD/PmbA family protein n=1 Tax=Pseudomonas sp. MAG002Y TaxID=2678690 RepID=UPI001C60EFEF|nr:TldD/PmbA family protein [Pseudomonas sp. MAG002Y]MBW5412222.1 TldD/PmbA family protein [Pseudomonas sp. MAG002Y]
MFDVTASLQQRFALLHSRADTWSLRYVSETTHALSVTRNVIDPPFFQKDEGAMVYVRLNGIETYAATSDLTVAGLQKALEQAEQYAQALARHSLIDFTDMPVATARADYLSPNLDKAFPDTREWLDILAAESASVPGNERFVDWSAQLNIVETEQIYLNNHGACVRQAQRFLFPDMHVTAYDGTDTQTRTLGFGRLGQQGGREAVERIGLIGCAPRLADEALQLLLAPNTPSETLDLLLMPDQMILQIHESIGHPLELDRILGDERNYAGTSFVTPDMFGSYRYGSELLNVSFDPDIPEEIASYSHDDDGSPARKALLIEDGILKRPLGGALSQRRSGMAGVANSRACSWNRPPIDRMANLNVENGDQSLAQLIAGIERGVLMASNRSWSIDDARNKFQFGCEWGQMIENGQLTHVVKNPNYRGVSAQFWRSLSAVGDASTREVMGTAHCGKGEPNQAIRVGHASPACVFSHVDVFGGEV